MEFNLKEFSNRLKNSIKESGKSRNKILKECTFSEHALKSWLYGKKIPTILYICELCKSLNVDPEYLLGYGKSPLKSFIDNEAGTQEYIIKSLKELKGSKSYQKLSDETGIKLLTLQTWVTGRSVPSIDNLTAICSACFISLNGFLGWKSEYPKVDTFDRGKLIENIRFLIKKYKLTQTEFGNLIGCGQVTVSDWLRGRYLPNLETVCVIVKVFSISFEQLLGWEEFRG